MILDFLISIRQYIYMIEISLFVIIILIVLPIYIYYDAAEYRKLEDLLEEKSKSFRQGYELGKNALKVQCCFAPHEHEGKECDAHIRYWKESCERTSREVDEEIVLEKNNEKIS